MQFLSNSEVTIPGEGSVRIIFKFENVLNNNAFPTEMKFRKQRLFSFICKRLFPGVRKSISPKILSVKK